MRQLWAKTKIHKLVKKRCFDKGEKMWEYVSNVLKKELEKEGYHDD